MKMVETYGISMIEQLKEYPESHNVCADIGMCYRDQSAGFVNMEDFPSKNYQQFSSIVPLLILFLFQKWAYLNQRQLQKNIF